MRRPAPRLQRLLRALLACWALLLVFEPPAASASCELRTLSAWLAPRAVRSAAGQSAQRAVGKSAAAQSVTERSAAVSSAAVPSVPQGVLAASLPLLAAGAKESWLPRLDGRYLYLEVQRLLC